MVNNRKHAFWQALVFTVLVFGVGLVLGFFLENQRAGDVEKALTNSDISLLDEQLKIRAIEEFGVECDVAVQGVFDFADRIYWEALKLEEYGAVSQFSDETFFILHKKYDLLRALLWMESADLRNKCGDDFHTLVYLYEYNVDDVELRAKQLFFSKLLLDVKERHPGEVLLIPIAVNMDLSSVDLATSGYDINDYPVVIVDEEKVVDKVVTLEEIENIIFG